MRTLVGAMVLIVARGIVAFAKPLVSWAYWLLFVAEWRLRPHPEFFNHEIDLFWKWQATGESYWLERGVYSSLALSGGNVLELACGDGFNAKYFYSGRSRRVVACDFDPAAIALAQSGNNKGNLDFVLADIRTNMPDGKFDNIIWDAAIEHFTQDEISDLLRNIKSRLNPAGILSGYTIVERTDGHKSLHHHEYEFRSKDDLLDFLTPHFLNVRVFETIHASRHNLYFWASDSVIPFDKDWPLSVKEVRRS